MTLIPSWVTKLGPDNMKLLRRMPRSIGERWLRMHSEFGLNSEEETSALDTCFDAADPRPVRSFITYDPHQKLFVTAAWLCGASLSQLAHMFDKARTSVLDQLNRTLSKDERKLLRLRVSLTYEQLGILREEYYRLVNDNPDLFRDIHPSDVALLIDQLRIDRETTDTEETAYQ